MALKNLKYMLKKYKIIIIFKLKNYYIASTN